LLSGDRVAIKDGDASRTLGANLPFPIPVHLGRQPLEKVNELILEVAHPERLITAMWRPLMK